MRYSAGANKGFVIENEEELSRAVDRATMEASQASQSGGHKDENKNADDM